MRIRILLLVFLLSALSSLAHAQSNKRLVLKDGSYQSVTSWEVKGDRVRYYSAERGEWEELPSSMVDWKATESYEKEAAESKQKDLNRSLQEEEEEAKKEGEASPQVAPGIRLTAGGGVFLLDNFKGQPQLVELVQTGSEIDKQMGKNILRAAINPVASSKQSIELKGPHAHIQAHTQNPEIYLDIDQDTRGQALDLTDHFRLVRLQEKKGNRVLGNLKISMIGNVSQEGSAYVKARAEKFSGDWIKIVPLEAMTHGEYAIVEMLSPKEMNLYVWDFGVNPQAGENPTAWKPEPPKEKKTGTDESPVLIPHH